MKEKRKIGKFSKGIKNREQPNMQAPSLRLGNLIGSISFHNKISSRRKHQPVQQNN